MLQMSCSTRLREADPRALTHTNRFVMKECNSRRLESSWQLDLISSCPCILSRVMKRDLCVLSPSHKRLLHSVFCLSRACRQCRTQRLELCENSARLRLLPTSAPSIPACTVLTRNFPCHLSQCPLCSHRPLSTLKSMLCASPNPCHKEVTSTLPMCLL